MNANIINFIGRRYLVTGASGGAGSATAALLEECGAAVTRVRGELPSGQYDGIFHAAGVEHLAGLALSNEASISKVFDVSVAMAFDLMKDVGARKSLLKDGGSIVMMSSVAAVCGTAGMSIYSASKAAIEGLCRSAAVELAPRRIRVNCIRAGGFLSPMHFRIIGNAPKEVLQKYENQHPLGFGSAQDVANLAVFMLSDYSRWMTGACVPLDGGYSCR